MPSCFAMSLLLTNFSNQCSYGAETYCFPGPNGASIVDLNGTALQLAPLPFLQEAQLVGADGIYETDGGPNSIYSLTTGKPIWNGSTQSRGPGAVAGPRVYFQSGYEVLAEVH